MADFHFIRPWWLLSLIAVFIVSYLLKRLQVSNSGWQQVIPKHLASKLINGEQTERSNSLFIPCLITVLAIVALAGPAWQKLPQPVYNVQKGAVIVMDMSNSMYSTDLTPNRLTRARYKAIDLLEKLNEGDTGLIVYAGDSFIISPLTEDINNIKLLLPALSPQLMPVQGSNPLLALSMANDMLKNAGHLEGDIYWFTDDVDQYDIDEINALATKFNHRINILGIGTKNAAPIKMPNGQLLKDDTGAIVIPHLTSGALQGIANNARGTYQSISNSASDIDSLVSNAIKKAELKEKETQLADGDQFKEAGPYLILLILPLLLGYFRRGNLLAVLPCLLFFTETPISYAAQESVEKNVLTTTNNTSANSTSNISEVEAPAAEPSSSFWNDLWQTKDQQGQKKYNNEQFEEAAQQFENPMWQGSAHYKNGNYEQALESFKKSDSAEALYNQGNSLAKLQKFDEAIDAYKAALSKNPNHENAKANQSLIEQILQQQEKQKQDQQGDGDSSDEKQDGEENQENSDSEQSEQDQEQQSGNDSQDQSDQESSDKNQEQQSQEEKEQQEKPSENSSDNSDDDTQESAEDNAAKPSEEDSQDEESLAEQQAQNEASEQEKGEAGDVKQLTEAEQAAQEEEQKHQQLLKKVTDDPYLLLRNKMQLEYQKRRNQDSGVNKKW